MIFVYCLKDLQINTIKEYIDKKEQWIGTWDYDKMVNTYNRIRK